MATTWGAWSGPVTNRFRVGIDLTTSGTTLTERYYVECTAAVNDDMVLTYSGSRSGSTSFRKTSSGVTLVSTFSQARSPGSSYSFGATLSGVYNGANPNWTRAITMPAVPPSAPAAPTIVTVWHDSVRINFSAPSSNGGAPIIEHGIQFATNSTFTSGVSTRSWATSRDQGHAGLSPSTKYWVRVRERNSAGWGAWSPAATFTTTAATPRAPGTPSISALTASTATASWTAPSSPSTILEYNFQIARNSGFTTGLSSVSSTTTSRGIVGMTRATDYWCRVRARNSAGWGPWSGVRQFRSAPELPVVSDTHTATAISRSSATITGFSMSDTGGESPTNVRVQHNSSASATGATLVTRGSWGDVQLSGLAANATRHYRYAVANSAGWSAYSGWKSFATLNDAPDDITGLVLVGTPDETSASLDWPAPNANGATITGYRIELSKSPTFLTLVRAIFTEDTEFAFLELEPGTTYYVRVRANGEPNNGGWGQLSFTTAGGHQGLRIFTFVGGVRKECTAYTFVNGVRKQLRVMTQVNGSMKG